VVGAAVLLGGCSTSTAIQKAHWHFLDGDTEAAVQALGNVQDIDGKDRLLYWLEKGMYQHYAGNYENSTRLLLEASAFLESTDFISVSDGAKSLLANDWAGSYRGEYSERLWIHSVLMMNFLHLGRYESAAVEARKSLEVINRHPKILNEDHFTRALIGLSFEAAQQTNDAYIVNNNLAESVNQFFFNQLIDTQATALGFTPATRLATFPPDQQHAVVFISSGFIPAKHSGSLLTSDASRISFAEYLVPYSSPVDYSISIDGRACDCYNIISDFGHLVSHSLNRRGAALVTKAVFRAAAKEAVAEALEQTDEIAGEIARILLFALEEADIRSWRSLPRHFQMVRVPLAQSASQLLVSVGGSNHQFTLPAPSARPPLMFYTVHASQPGINRVSTLDTVGPQPEQSP
ncbi:MAG: hypothetical protein AAF404_19150, partial [Pseudomonadota bacterium]